MRLARWPNSIPTLLLLLGLAWGTGTVYLLVRAYLAIPIPLVFIDSVHVYVGIASMVFFIEAIARGRPETGETQPEPRQRLWWVLLAALVTLYASGALAVLPWPVSVRQILVNAHLLSAVGAAPLTTRYLWEYRPRTARIGLPVAVLVLFLPLVALLALPRAVAPLTQSGAGAAWTAAGLHRVFLDRLAITQNGGSIVAGGNGLYLGLPGNNMWRRLPLTGLVLGLALPRGPIAAYVGTEDGLYATRDINGPYRRLPFPAREVHGIAVDPSDTNIVWATSRAGIWRSTDLGEHWTAQSAGVASPEEAWALSYFDGTPFASDAGAVYRWNGTRWTISSDQRFVVALDVSSDGGRLFASSMGQGVRVFDKHAWTEADQGLAGNHAGTPATHVVSVTDLADGRTLAATMLDGVGVSTDSGRAWIKLRSGLPVGTVWRVLLLKERLVAATDQGVYAYPGKRDTAAGPGWWLLMVVGSLLGGAGGAALLASRGPGRTWKFGRPPVG